MYALASALAVNPEPVSVDSKVQYQNLRICSPSCIFFCVGPFLGNMIIEKFSCEIEGMISLLTVHSH